MRWVIGVVRVAALTFAVGVAVLAAGCGATAGSDPFTGSWSASGNTPADVVISRTGDDYRVAIVIDVRTASTLSFKRHGDRLEATVSVKEPLAHSWKIVVERRDGSDRLFWTESGGTTSLSRVSDSTAFPTSSPTSR